MSFESHYYPTQYEAEVNFNCDDCGILNEDIEVTVSAGYWQTKCKICNSRNYGEHEDA